MKLLAFLGCLVTLVGASRANAQTIVGGRVVDAADRRVLAGVTVELLGARDTVLTSAKTAADGAFMLMVPGGGTYRVRLVRPGGGPQVSDSIRVADGELTAREFAIATAPRALDVNEVDKPTVPAPGSPQPRYPRDLLASGVSGCVLAEFEVDTAGYVDPNTFKVLAHDGPGFVQAVYDALPSMRFVPAEKGGRKVRQRVAQPFTFAIDKEPKCKAFRSR